METVYKLTINEITCVFFLLSDALDTIKTHEFDNYDKDGDPIKFELEVCEMSEEEIEALGEFDGF